MNVCFAWRGNLAGQVAFLVAGLHLLVHGLPMLVLFLPRHTITMVMTRPAIVWLVLMGSKRFASPIMGIICGGLNAYCMQTRPLFLRTSGSSGVPKALLLERNGQLSCNPKKNKKNWAAAAQAAHAAASPPARQPRPQRTSRASSRLRCCTSLENPRVTTVNGTLDPLTATEAPASVMLWEISFVFVFGRDIYSLHECNDNNLKEM